MIRAGKGFGLYRSGDQLKESTTIIPLTPKISKPEGACQAEPLPLQNHAASETRRIPPCYPPHVIRGGLNMAEG